MRTLFPALCPQSMQWTWWYGTDKPLPTAVPFCSFRLRNWRRNWWSCLTFSLWSTMVDVVGLFLKRSPIKVVTVSIEVIIESVVAGIVQMQIADNCSLSIPDRHSKRQKLIGRHSSTHDRRYFESTRLSCLFRWRCIAGAFLILTITIIAIVISVTFALGSWRVGCCSRFHRLRYSWVDGVVRVEYKSSIFTHNLWTTIPV